VPLVSLIAHPERSAGARPGSYARAPPLSSAGGARHLPLLRALP